jgi:hypothetical protein
LSSRARRRYTFITRKGIARGAFGASALLVACQFGPLDSASAVDPPDIEASTATFVDLGAATTYSILGGLGVTSTGTDTVLSGDLGLSPSGVITGFTPAMVNGTIHDKDAAAELAQSDRAEAYTDAAAQASTTTFSGDQAGVTFHPGVHTTVAAFTNTGTITLDADGDASAVFIFQVAAALSSAASSKVILTDGALANNVFWQVSGAVSLGASARFVGTFLGNGAMTFGDGASIKGRALTPGAVAVTNSPFTEPIDDFTAPIVTLDGGTSRSTHDTTPAISGTADEPAGTALAITVAGQTLHPTVGDGGAWVVSAGALTAGPHTVVASITDASQNVGTASQVLTVDVTAPTISIDDGASAATNDTTPSISGTTDEPAGSTVTVTLGAQTLLATVGDAAGWSVNVASLTEAAHGVVATITDAADNTGMASQVLTVDLTVPVVAIDGGPTESTEDTSPWIYGTTAEQAGTVVHVSIGGQNLTATVLTGGSWGVSATALPLGPQSVVASITDPAQNTGTDNQTLTITSRGGPESTYQPDAAIRLLHKSFVGSGIYDVAEQRVTKLLNGPARKATFEVRVVNRGDATDRMEIRGTAGSGRFKVSYLAGGKDVTSDVVAGAYLTTALSPGESVLLVIKVSRTKAAHRGDRRTFELRAGSSHQQTAHDTVAAVVRIAR